MTTTTSWILVGAIAFTMFLQGEAISCWSCGSATDRECGDEPDTSKMTELTDCKYCIKTKSTDSYGFHDVYRSCYTSDQVDAKGLTEVNLGCTECSDCGETNARCICDGDKCNHASQSILSIATLILSLAATFKLF